MTEEQPRQLDDFNTQGAKSQTISDNEISQPTTTSSARPLESYLPVEQLTSSILHRTFQALSQATHSSPLFGSAVSWISIDPISVLFHALDDFGIPVFTAGEFDNLLRFTHTPLSHGLRITSSDPASIYLLTAHEETPYPLTCIADLEAIILAVLDTWRALCSHSGSLRFRRPLPSTLLLSALEDESYTAVTPSFTECARAVSRKCHLDACVELLTPFGFQPKMSLKNGQDICVRFSHPALAQKVEITRFDAYVPETRIHGLLDMYKAAVIVTGLATADEETKDADRVRRVSLAAIHAGLADEYQQGAFPKFGLVFSLALRADWKMLAERLMGFLGEERERDREERERDAERWLGKQSQYYENWDKEPGLRKKSELRNGRSSLLRCEVLPDDVVERVEQKELGEFDEDDEDGGCPIDAEEAVVDEDENSEGGFEEYENDRWADAVDSGVDITEDEGEELQRANVPDMGTAVTDEMKQGELSEWLGLTRVP
ncbi:hypothetical protein K491DRAFT_687669 [Lophiostoma macrostomum CBS 122681]|uniref:Uncharacterized protein n=1 Tax=Lophiostoma macrostomum CBS 122681 TaxID=1314788 RepID=A0A6A6TMZ4_9PLEO|nr:hypothetical protein K491DRAFT_687669 [Lophiostoma macrostomum CBS 122681]